MAADSNGVAPAADSMVVDERLVCELVVRAGPGLLTWANARLPAWRLG